MDESRMRISADEAKNMVRRRFRELDAGNIAIFDELFSADYRLNFPGRSPMDLEQTKGFYQEFYRAFPDLQHDIKDQVSEGDRVVTWWTATGTHRGPLMDIEPTGQQVTFTGINIYRIDGDKLAESHVAWDMLGLIRQLQPTYGQAAGVPSGSVLQTSRIPISLVPERFIAEATQEEGKTLEDLGPQREKDGVLLTQHELAKTVLDLAAKRWWEVIPLWNSLNFTMQHQEQTQWCWAATSVSVVRYYRSNSWWTQCEMVNQEKGQTTCCQNGSSSACNQPNVLDAPLNRADVLDRMQGGSVGYQEIRGEIDAGRPLAWRIGWSGGGGHFAVIEGYQLGAEWVTVDDPWYGQSDVALSTLTGGTYQGSGTWTHSYFTRRPSPFVLPPLFEVFQFPWEIWQRVALEAGVSAERSAVERMSGGQR